ncbi:MAG: DUF3822 family protein [Bernardetiaceae bacterium]
MSYSTQAFRLVRQFKDEKLDIEQIGRYRLSYHWYGDALAIAAFDMRSKDCLLFEEYHLNTEYAGQAAEEIQVLIRQHHLLSAGYWRDVLWVSTSDIFALIPTEFFDQKQASQYLYLNTGKTIDPGQVYSFPCLEGEQTCLFEMELSLVDFLEQQYKNSTLILTHDTGIFLEGVFRQQSSQLHQLNLLVGYQRVVILNINAKNLRFLNAFLSKTPEDVLYFTLSVAESLGIERDELALKILGNIDKDSTTITLLERYIKTTDYGSRPSSVVFSPQFDGFADFAAHRFFTLFASSFIHL